MNSRGGNVSTRPSANLKDEVCRNFLRGHCYNKPCHRRHPREDIPSQAVSETSNRQHGRANLLPISDQERNPQSRQDMSSRQPTQISRDRRATFPPLAAESGKEGYLQNFTQQNRPPSNTPLHTYTQGTKLHTVVKLPPPRHLSALSRANYVVANMKSFDHWDPGTRSWAWRDEPDYQAHDSQSPLSSPESSSVFSLNAPTVSSQSSISLPYAEGTVTNDYYRNRAPGYCWDWARGHCDRDPCKYRHGSNDDDKYVEKQAMSKENIPQRPPGDHFLPSNLSDMGRGEQESRSFGSRPSYNSPPFPARAPPAVQPSISSYMRQEHKEPCRGSIETSSRPPPELLTITMLDHTKVKFGPGFLVRDVTTGFETRWVLLGNIPSNVTAADITGILEPFGTVVAVRLPECNANLMTVKAQFFNSTEAMQAATLLNGAQVFNQTISVRRAVNNTRSGNGAVADTSVRIQWDAPGRLGYAGYSSLAAAQGAMFNATKYPLRGSYITATLYEGLPTIDAYNVRFHLPPDAEEKDVEMFGHPEGVMLQQPNYLSLENAIDHIRELLEELGELTFDVLPPPYRDGMVKAWANFSSPPVARSASDYLNGRRLSFIGKKKVWVHHVQTVSYVLPSNVYSRVATDIDLLRESCWRRGPATFVTIDRRKQAFDPNQPVFIKLSGDNTRDLGRLKTEFEMCLRGETVKQDGKVVWDDFFGRLAGAIFLNELERKHPEVSTETNIPRRSMSLFGSAGQRAFVRDAILRKLADLRGQRIRTIPLAGRLVGLFMSADLKQLQNELGHENVMFSPLERTLTIRGNDVAYQAAQQAVRNAQNRHSRERCQKATACPVCFNEASSPVTLHCGHSWCRSCLSSYLIAACDNKVFPLTCLGNEAKCSQFLSLTIAQEILSASEFDNLTHAAFFAYIHSRPDEFHHCPTPDCAQVYRTAPQDTVLQCPSCLARICPSCHVEYHDGQECADRQNGGEKLFKEWSKLHNVKKCPGCRASIEKSDGCNHMTCIRCQTHICWVCMKTFPKGEKIYDHMRKEHGGIGL